MDYTVHALSDVQTQNIGKGSVIWQYTVVLRGAVIGSNCNINCGCFIENDVFIGDNVTIKPGVQVWNGIKIEDDVFVGPNVTFTNDLIPRSKKYPERFVKTIIKHGASIGANATIVCGLVIGEFSLIGAGSVVTKDIPPYTVWYGNPARHKGYVTADGVMLDMSLIDRKKNRQYILLDNKPVLQEQ